MGAYLSLFIETIRRAAVEPGHWLNVQTVTEEFLGADGSQLAFVDHANGNRFWSRTPKSPELDDFLKVEGPKSEPVRFAARNPHWRAFCDYDFISEAEIARSWFYQECQRFGVGYRLGLRLLDTPGSSSAIVFTWRPSRGHVQSEEQKRLSVIQEHLRTAAFVARTLGESYEAERGTADAFDLLPVAAFFCRTDGTVVYANSSAEEIFESADGIVVHRNRLRFFSSRSQRTVIESLEKCAGALSREADGTSGFRAAVRRRSGLPDYHLLITPIARRFQFLGDTMPLALVLVTDPAAKSRPVKAAIVDGFGFTAAEADVALEYACGSSLPQIAALRSVSLETVRKQIKVMMSKAGVRRQAELMRVLLILPQLKD